MKKYNTYYGIFLCLLAAGYILFAISHPEMSFPWANWVSYTLYALYAVLTILVFCINKFENANFLSCLILTVEIAALGLIVISIGIRKTPSDHNWYLPAGLFLSVVGNFANSFISLRKKKTK